VLWVATLLIIGFIAFPYINLPSHTSSHNQIPGEFEEYIIPVDGMTCAGCKFHVERAIKELDGIIYVEADHQKGQVYVKFDEDKININKIVSQISEIGYKPTGYSKINKKGENR
jgi:copper chaperone CopZ